MALGKQAFPLFFMSVMSKNIHKLSERETMYDPILTTKFAA
jgi:hypothetical protein